MRICHQIRRVLGAFVTCKESRCVSRHFRRGDVRRFSHASDSAIVRSCPHGTYCLGPFRAVICVFIVITRGRASRRGKHKLAVWPVWSGETKRVGLVVVYARDEDKQSYYQRIPLWKKTSGMYNKPCHTASQQYHHMNNQHQARNPLDSPQPISRKNCICSLGGVWAGTNNRRSPIVNHILKKEMYAKLDSIDLLYRAIIPHTYRQRGVNTNTNTKLFKQQATILK